MYPPFPSLPSAPGHFHAGDEARLRLVNSWWAMRLDLEYVLDTLRAHETDLRQLGVAHAAVFGSVARGDASAESDIDVLVDLDEDRPMGIFEYARLRFYISELFDRPSDVVNRRTLKLLLRADILDDAIHAF
jgi:predicted nucleotidyltransferase